MDFDARQGSLTDNTGLRTLIPTDISIKQIGKFKGAYFNGSTSKIDCGSDFIGIGDITISGIINAYSLGESAGRILDNGKLLVFVSDINRCSCSRNEATGATTTTNAFAFNKPFHLAITSTNSGITNIYINGILSGTANQNTGTPVVGTTNVLIGNRNLDDRTFHGIIHRLKVFSGILTPYEIAQEFSSERGSYGI